MYHTPYAKASIVEEDGQKTVGGTDCGEQETLLSQHKRSVYIRAHSR